MTDSLKAAMEWLDSPEGEADIKEHFRELEAEKTRKREFFESPVFDELLTLFSDSTDQILRCDDWAYGNDKDYMSSEEYHLLFDSIWIALEDEIVEDLDAMFTTLEVRYRNYKLSMIHGQGTVTFIEKMKVTVAHHATSHTFKFPVYEKLLNNITNHANGALGLWCATNNPDWIQGFGGNVYEVEYDDSNVLMMDFSDFSSMCRDTPVVPDDNNDNPRQYFIDKRQEYIDEGYTVLAIVEGHGGVDMLIILDMDCITRFEELV